VPPVLSSADAAGAPRLARSISGARSSRSVKSTKIAHSRWCAPHTSYRTVTVERSASPQVELPAVQRANERSCHRAARRRAGPLRGDIRPPWPTLHLRRVKHCDAGLPDLEGTSFSPGNRNEWTEHDLQVSAPHG